MDQRTALQSPPAGLRRRPFLRARLEHAPGLLSDGLAALALFPVQITYLLSYTALVWSGPLAFGRPAGLAAMLLTTVVAGLITGLGSSFRLAFGSIDSNATAIMATLAAALAADMAGADEASLLATTVVGMAGAGVVAGACLLVIGQARAGALVRMLPPPVVAGFLGATGWLLSAGAIRISAGGTVALPILAVPAVDARLAATAAIAAALGLATSRTRSPYAVPAGIGVCLLLHHAVFAALGSSLDAQRAAGWLMTFPSLAVEFPWSPSVLGHVRWDALAHQGLGLVALVVVATISLLLTTSGLETATREEADIDRELRVGGLSSLVSGAAGGTIGFAAFGRSHMLKVSGGRSRIAPILTAVLVAVVPSAFPGLLSLVPVTVLGGLLLFLGCSLLVRWVVRTRREMGLREWAIVPAIVALAIAFGIIVGVLAGLMLGCASFVATYAVGPPIRASYFGDVAVSNVWRPAADRRRLRETAGERLVLYLQGFLFFGTADRLLREIRDRLDSAAGIRALILDFGDVDGVDSSAISSLRRIAEIGVGRGVDVVFCAVPPVVSERLGATASAQAHFRIVPSLDQALEGCEEDALGASCGARAECATLAESLAREFRDPALAEAILDRVTSLDVPAGGLLMEQGQASDDLLFIERGRAAVFTAFGDKGPLRVRTLVAGTMVGELGFYLDTPRMATIRAETDCRVARIARADLKRLEDERPQAALEFLRFVTQRLCQRIQDKDQLIEGLVRGMKRAEF